MSVLMLYEVDFRAKKIIKNNLFIIISCQLFKRTKLVVASSLMVYIFDLS